MRCQKAQRLMNELTLSADKEPIDLMLAEHVRSCASCRSHAAAKDILARAFKIEKVRTPETETPLSFVRTRIESLASQKMKEHNSMSSFKKSFLDHPVMSFGFLGAVVALFLMSIIPVSCSREVGYSLGVGDDNQVASAITSDAAGTASIRLQNGGENTWVGKEIDPDQMVKALESLGISNASIDIKSNEGGKTIELSGLDSREQAREALLAILEVAGLGDQVKLTARQESVSGSLLDQCMASVKELVFSSEGKSDEQVRAEISAALEEAGLFDANVQYSTDADGHKMIFIGTDNVGDSTVLNGEFKWTADSGGNRLRTPGDSTIRIKLNSDDDNQTIDVQKTVTVSSDN